MKTLPPILVLRDDCQFSRELRQRGFEVLNLPMISTQRESDLAFFQKILGSIRHFDAIFITSRKAAEIFADEVTIAGAAHVPSIYVLGERSRDLLASRGFTVEFRETANTADELLDELGESAFKGKQVLFVCGERSMRTIPARLQPISTVVEATVYVTIENRIEKIDILPQFQRDSGWACFFSPSAVDAYVRNELPLGGSLRVAAIGATTADSIRSHGFSVDFTSEKANALYFAKSLAAYIENFE